MLRRLGLRKLPNDRPRTRLRGKFSPRLADSSPRKSYATPIVIAYSKSKGLETQSYLISFHVPDYNLTPEDRFSSSGLGRLDDDEMYLRAVHAEHDIPTLRAFIRENPLGIFTTAIDSPSFPFLQSSHIPWLLDVQDDDSVTELGILRGHMARANPQTKAIIEHLKSTNPTADEGQPQTLTRDVMILFNGPAHHYVTPKFYTSTKPATGKVVPTWNYAAVQVYGRATVYFDSTAPTTDAFLEKQVAELSRYTETAIMKYERPWDVRDAPEKYVDALKKAIIGVEVEITDIGGKWKMSQEMAAADREGVVEGFERMGTEEALKIAETVKEKGALSEKKKEEAKAGS